MQTQKTCFLMFYHTKHATWTGFDDSSSEPGFWWFGTKRLSGPWLISNDFSWFQSSKSSQRLPNSICTFIYSSLRLLTIFKFGKKQNPFQSIFYLMTVLDFSIFRFLAPKIGLFVKNQWTINRFNENDWYFIDFWLNDLFWSQKSKFWKIRDSH